MKESQLLELEIDLALFEYNDTAQTIDEDLLPAGIQRISKQELQEPFTVYMKKPDYDYLTYSMFGYESFEIYEKPMNKEDRYYHRTLRRLTDIVGAPEWTFKLHNLESSMLPTPSICEAPRASEAAL